MKLFLKVLAFVCLSVPLWGQGYRYDSNAFTSANNVPAGSQSTMFTVPFAKITVCAYPDNGSQPCTNTVPIYQDPALTVAAQNPITADVHGRFGFWKSAGTYTFSMVSPGGEFLGTFVISLGGAGVTGGGCSTGGIPTTNGSVTGDNTSTNCGYNNRSGDTATVPADVQTFGSNQLTNNSAQNVVAVGNDSGNGNTAENAVLIGNTSGANLSPVSGFNEDLVAIGDFALDCNSLSCRDFVAIGDSPANLTAGRNAIAIGLGPLDNSFVDETIALGDGAAATSSAQQPASTSETIALGNGAVFLHSSTTPDDPTISNLQDVVGIGNGAGSNIQGSSNDIIGIGDGAGANFANGSHDIVALGNGAASGYSVSLSGPQTVNDIVAIGDGAGGHSGGSNVVAIGNAALLGNALGPDPTQNTGTDNVAIGDHPLAANLTGQDNVAIGTFAGSIGWTGVPNSGPANANTSGSHNTWVGDFSGPKTATQLSNTIALGYQAQNDASNQTVIGNSSITSLKLFGCPSGQAVQADGTGTCYTPGAGGGITGSGTTGYLPKWTGSTSQGDSAVDDGVTTASTLTVHEGIAVADGTGNGGAFNATEGTAGVSPTAGHDILYADSTNHCFEYSANGGAFACLGAGGGGSGTVTSFAAPSGSWPSWLVPTVTNSTTTPSLAVAASAIPNSALATQTANTVLGALTATTPSGLAVPSCSGASNALTWTTGTGFGCNTITVGSSTTVASAEVVAFSATPTFSTSYNVSRIVLTGNITSFTLGAGADGQSKTLCFAQDATGGRTVAGPANVHGFFTVGSTASKWNCQSYAYDNTDSIWLAESPGVLNQ